MTRNFNWRVNDQEFTVTVNSHGNIGTLSTGSATQTYQVLQRTPYGLVVELEGRIERVFAAPERDGYRVWWNGRTFRLTHVSRKSERSNAATPAQAEFEVRATMPGRIVRVEVSPGDKVEEKQRLLVIESMKMETTIQSPRVGKVLENCVRAGQVVDVGDILMKLS